MCKINKHCLFVCLSFSQASKNTVYFRLILNIPLLYCKIPIFEIVKKVVWSVFNVAYWAWFVQINKWKDSTNSVIVSLWLCLKHSGERIKRYLLQVRTTYVFISLLQFSECKQKSKCKVWSCGLCSAGTASADAKLFMSSRSDRQQYCCVQPVVLVTGSVLKL